MREPEKWTTTLTTSERDKEDRHEEGRRSCRPLFWCHEGQCKVRNWIDFPLRCFLVWKHFLFGIEWERERSSWIPFRSGLKTLFFLHFSLFSPVCTCDASLLFRLLLFRLRKVLVVVLLSRSERRKCCGQWTLHFDPENIDIQYPVLPYVNDEFSILQLSSSTITMMKSATQGVFIRRKQVSFSPRHDLIWSGFHWIKRVWRGMERRGRKDPTQVSLYP